MSAKGGPLFTFSLPGGAARSLPHQLRHWLLCNGFTDGLTYFSILVSNVAILLF